jgi:glycosyltransferase involved in cell wall biosynthesis/ubiquinone/menaquinone biosynthesis C-methylase UbiE
MAGSTEARRPDTFVYVAADLAGAALLVDPRLGALEDRHIVELARPPGLEPPDRLLAGHPGAGVVLEVRSGLLSRSQRALARNLLRERHRLLLYWPEEAAVEVADRERLAVMSAQGLLRRVIVSTFTPRQQLQLARRALSNFRRAARRALVSGRQGLPIETQLEIAAQPVPWSLTNELRSAPRPTPLALSALPTPQAPFDGVGVYVRTDFWNSMTSGGSYGHTCFVANELARSTREFVCLLPQRYELLDELGVKQARLEPHDTVWDEYAVIRATEPTRRQLLPLLRLLGASYVYERLCPGNVAAAAACRELGIPYVVEYNGSEISISKSFGGAVPAQQALQLALEEAAFRNATLISVVSDRVREDLLVRGLPAEKVLVNPNGVDPSRYRPLEGPDREELRRSLGFAPAHCVVGFTGTFGGWHGIDVLAAALPRIAERAPHVRFLLVGDGPRRGIVGEAVAAHGLQERVQMVGRVPQQRGARLLGACDVFVSPHSGHMVDQPFFGSPTKLFEYMAMAGGIVASDLEQIGQVLRPALSAAEIVAADVQSGEYRAVLCRPGDVDDFVDAVVGLASRPELARRLGANAREAAIREFSWEQHVRRLWQALLAQRPPVETAPSAASTAPPAGPALPLVAAEDAYKRQTQEHWNAEACGSQAARAVEPRSLEWYREVERYRYQDYAPWMPKVMEFSRHAGEDVLEIGGGIGTDLAQFAAHGARVVDVDLAAGHLEHARRNFELRGLQGRFVHHDAETLPFEDSSFDLVYSNGVIHHTPNTARLVGEIARVLRPGGRVIVMVYAQNSIHYWLRLFYELGLKAGMIHRYSMGEIMSRNVERGPDGTRPLVKVYSRSRLRALFRSFEDVRILKRQLTPPERPRGLRWVPTCWLERVGGWNLVLKARKPRS